MSAGESVSLMEFRHFPESFSKVLTNCMKRNLPPPLSRNSYAAFYGIRSSLPLSEEPAISPYPVPHGSSVQPLTLTLRSALMLSAVYALALQMVSSL